MQGSGRRGAGVDRALRGRVSSGRQSGERVGGRAPGRNGYRESSLDKWECVSLPVFMSRIPHWVLIV